MKLPLLAAYAVGGLVLALWPLALRRQSTVAEIPASGAPAWQSIVGIAAGLLAGATLPWWRREGGSPPAVSVIEVLLLLAAAVAVAAIMLKQPVMQSSKVSRCIQSTAAGTLIAFLSFTTFTYEHTEVQRNAWHHWGAYIGPVELMLQGAQMYRDFPPQYGLGPTLLIAAGCGETCWTWTYYATALATLLYCAGIATLALEIAKPLSAAQRACVLLLAVVACLLWTAFPPMLGSATATPSVTGMRFLPAVVLAWLLVTRDRGNSHVPFITGHIAWALASLWSIESAFYATCIWWPYYMLLRGFRGCITLAAWLAGLIAVFLASYMLAYGGLPTVVGVFAYIVNPPGELPIDPLGAVIFFVVAMALAIATNVHEFRWQGNASGPRSGLVVLLLAYSTFSYFLGRSHDNNILNLFPFLLLAILYAWKHMQGFGRALASGLLACMIGWLAAFNWAPWKSVDGPWFDAQWFGRVMPSEDPAQSAFPAEAQQVIARAHTVNMDPVTIFGPYANPSSPSVRAVWSAVHAPGNLVTLSPPLRREFLQRTAKTLKRSGWLVMHESLGQVGTALIADYDTAYNRAQEFTLNGYHAIHYLPNP